MALNIKNKEVEELATELATATGESKTETIRKALLERRERLGLPSPQAMWQALRPKFEREIWSKLPEGVRGKAPSQSEQDEILGYGPDGF